MKRGRWQGAIQILLFNRDWYVGGAAGAALAAGAAFRVSWPWNALLLAGAATALFWLAASIAVSHYVYDLSALYEFRWVDRCLPRPPRRWVNIHAGLDETQGALCPGGEGRVLDIFDSQEMTEPSITRARGLSPSRSEPARWRALPLDDESADAVFLIFVAHELRRHEARVQLLREAGRILRLGGRIILTEHLRDWRNFLAFGPGFVHFFGERTWLQVVREAGLEASARSTITPFVHAFVLRRAYDPNASRDRGSAAVIAGRGA